MNKIVISLILTFVLCFSLTSLIAFAENDNDTAIIGGADEPQSIYITSSSADFISSYNTDCVIDNADLLSESEEADLEEQIKNYNEIHYVNIVVVTENGLGGKTPMDYADDYYDYNNYAPDGILLLVSMEDRDWYISTKGTCITAFTDAGIDMLSETFLSYLSNGEYYNAFVTFADGCDEFLIQYENGTPYDEYYSDDEYSSYSSSEKDIVYYLKYLAFALVGGFLLSLIPMSKLNGEMKTVNHKADAKDYMINGSLQINENRDMFMYRNVSRSPIPKQSSSSSHSGGSSTHTSSSGSSHGGGGGKF